MVIRGCRAGVVIRLVGSGLSGVVVVPPQELEAGLEPVLGLLELRSIREAAS